MDRFDVLRRPIVTEKALGKKEEERTLCFEVALNANKTQIKTAVEKLLKVKVTEVRTAISEGKLRRRGRSMGYRPDWKKAYVKVAEGQKLPEFTEF